MSILKKAKALNNKLKTALKDKESVQGLKDGVYHHTFKNPVIEELKEQRASICGKCEMNVIDEFYEVKDKDRRLSGRMCGECFCSLPYLLRQTHKSCELKKWKKANV